MRGAYEAGAGVQEQPFAGGHREMRMGVGDAVADAADAGIADTELASAEFAAVGSELHPGVAAAKLNDRWVQARVRSCWTEMTLEAERQISK